MERTALDLLVTARVWEGQCRRHGAGQHPSGRAGQPLWRDFTQPVIIIAGSEDSVVSTRRHSRWSPLKCSPMAG